ncbi:MAG: RDD family protein [Gammaproteobacteria bacterium]
MNAEQEEMYLPAPHGLRAVAWLIDGLIITIIFAFLPQPLTYLLLVAFFVAYHTVLVWWFQQTVGKALFGLRVKRIGKKPGVFWALGRASLGYWIVDVLGAGVIVALFNRRHRCLHDYVFSSVVIFKGSGAISAAELLARLVEFAERQRKAVEEKTETFTILAAFWAFLVYLANAIRNAIDLLTRTGAPASAPSIAEAFSLKAAAAITVAATIITGTVATNVPMLRDATEWLIRPRYIFSQPLGVEEQCAPGTQRHPTTGNCCARICSTECGPGQACGPSGPCGYCGR